MPLRVVAPTPVQRRSAVPAPSDATKAAAAASASQASGLLEQTIQVPSDVQEAVASVTGRRVNQVTVRRGAAIDQAASHMSADSYATEGVVHLPGRAPLSSDRSRMLLAHELTHVVQQRAGTAPSSEGSPAGVAAERQALSVEQALVNARVPAAPQGSEAPNPGQRPVVSRSTDAVSPQRVAGLPRTTVERRSPEPTSPRQGGAGGSGGGQAPRSPGGDERGPLAGGPGGPTTPGLPVPVPMNGSQPPAGRPDSAATAPDPSVQRRPSAGSGAPPRPPATAATKAAEPSDTAGSRPGGRRGAEAPPPADTATDDQWLERHARALYPHIRHLLRNEFFRDRERRGRLMRED